MRTTIVAGNWKMNGSAAMAEELVEGIKAGMSEVGNTDVVVCPPSIYLSFVAELIKDSPIALGAQNVSHEQAGAFTGEITAEMLKDAGCEYVIVGHSERRSLYGETDEVVAKKYARALEVGLTPILCVGELLEEREGGQTEAVVARQIDAVIDNSGVDSLGKGVIAYEPVWAIGTGKVATPEQAQDVHAFIRQRVAAHDAGVAESLRIQYGGSMKPDNADGLLGKPDIDGGLIGGASLKSADFLGICKAG